MKKEEAFMKRVSTCYRLLPKEIFLKNEREKWDFIIC